MKESLLSWNEYRFLFNQKATDLGLSPAKIDQLLFYSEKLFQNKLPVIHNLKHLSFQTGYKEDYLRRAIERPQNFYRNFKIAKKNGQSRTITEPLPGLKEIQYWILEHIIKKSPPNMLNNAYLEKRSIVSNAKFHIKQARVLNVDLEKYFDSIGSERVIAFFQARGYHEEISAKLASLITLENGLPQGSPSSPYLSSIITRDLDVELLNMCRSMGLRYSRYADDISVSGDFNPLIIRREIRRIVHDHGFRINNRKTTLKRQHQRQMVTGIVVNKKLSIKNSEIKKLRQEVYYISKYGLHEHLLRTGNVRRNYINVLEGRLNYFVSVKKNDTNLKWIRTTLSKLRKIEVQR